MTAATAASFSTISALSNQEIEAVRARLEGHALYRLYFEAALGDLDQGLDNRLIWLGAEGLAQGIVFDGLTVFSTLGRCPEPVLAAMLNRPGAVEIHATGAEAHTLHKLGGDRLRSDRGLLIFEAVSSQAVLSQVGQAAAPPREIRQLTAADHDRVLGLIEESGYGESVYSRWMLEQPFLGYFDGQRLVGTGGTITIDRTLGMANIGCFLTLPASRGRGLAGALVDVLLTDLAALGIHDVTLVTTDDNWAACRVYQKAGLTIREQRRELLFGPIG